MHVFGRPNRDFRDETRPHVFRVLATIMMQSLLTAKLRENAAETTACPIHLGSLLIPNGYYSLFAGRVPLAEKHGWRAWAM